MSRYKKMFERLYSSREGCFVPFIVLGDPSLETSVKIIHTLIKNGADALEVGIPFSDPLADGPTIQKSNLRALSKNNTFLEYFQVLKKLRQEYSKLPIGVLIYANLIHNQGIENFYLQCQNSGLDSVLIADVPIEESKIFYENSNKYKIDLIYICPPDADDNLLHKISLYSKGYIYVLSRSGVTGTENQNMFLSNNFVKKIKNFTSVPLLQGFGISNPSAVKKALSLGISGIVCGSAIIDIIEKYLSKENKMIEKIENFARKIKNSTKLI